MSEALYSSGVTPIHSRARIPREPRRFESCWVKEGGVAESNRACGSSVLCVKFLTMVHCEGFLSFSSVLGALQPPTGNQKLGLRRMGQGCGPGLLRVDQGCGPGLPWMGQVAAGGAWLLRVDQGCCGWSTAAAGGPGLWIRAAADGAGLLRMDPRLLSILSPV